MASLVIGACALFANGGAWQTGVPGTGSASASNKGRQTNVTIEDETLKIDLHPGYAAVDVRYRIHNTGPKVQQDFFFPSEAGKKNPDADIEPTQSHIEHYKISVDGKDLKSTNVAGAKQQSSEAKEEDSEAKQEGSDAEGEDSETTSGPFWRQESSTIKSWKKSVIPFERNQTREVTIHYNAPYAGNAETVSDDLHSSEATFAYSLSPAATWKGAIGKGKIEVNILHPEPDDVSIEKPKERFKKISDTHYEWDFENLKPTLADDIRIVAHSKYDSYPTGYSEEELDSRASYVIRNNQYFLDHKDYDATASSTLAPQGKRNYDAVNIKADPQRELQTPWCEGTNGDGVGKIITLDVT